MEEEKKPMGWKELYLKEDWWAIYLGLGIVIAVQVPSPALYFIF